MLQPLFENHLAFLRAHRGRISESGTGLSILSEAPGFSMWLPLDSGAVPPAEASAVRLLPWSGEGWPTRLEALGYRTAETLTYMELTEPEKIRAKHSNVAGLAIVEARDPVAAEHFSAVQSVGFLADDDPKTPWWRDFFRTMAMHNILDPRQSFYVASVGETPSAIMLVVRTDEVAGIYAVATHPAWRNQGLSGALLNYALQDERNIGYRFALQAISGSYAEGFYGRVGFATRFRSQVWRK